MKKLLLLVSAVILTGLLAVACGGGKYSDQMDSLLERYQAAADQAEADIDSDGEISADTQAEIDAVNQEAMDLMGEIPDSMAEEFYEFHDEFKEIGAGIREYQSTRNMDASAEEGEPAPAE